MPIDVINSRLYNWNTQIIKYHGRV